MKYLSFSFWNEYTIHPKNSLETRSHSNVTSSQIFLFFFLISFLFIFIIIIFTFAILFSVSSLVERFSSSFNSFGFTNRWKKQEHQNAKKKKNIFSGCLKLGLEAGELGSLVGIWALIWASSWVYVIWGAFCQFWSMAWRTQRAAVPKSTRTIDGANKTPELFYPLFYGLFLSKYYLYTQTWRLNHDEDESPLPWLLYPHFFFEYSHSMEPITEAIDHLIQSVIFLVPFYSQNVRIFVPFSRVSCQ